MTAHLAVALAALFAAGLTLYSGFGLGTLLLPVFALFYPVEVAVGDAVAEMPPMPSAWAGAQRITPRTRRPYRPRC